MALTLLFILKVLIRWWLKFKRCLHIEKGGDEQLKDELIAYNPLVPKGNELIATLMFEIDEPELRAAFLGKVGGIEEKIFMKINLNINFVHFV